MDEQGMRALLERVAEDPLPPVRVNIDLACGEGHRFLRRRRVYVSGGGPVAATAALALVAGILLIVNSRQLEPRPTASPMPQEVPATFNLSQPYALFGWLPAGLSAGVSQESPQVETLAMDRMGIPSYLTVMVWARGQCELSGTVSGQQAISCEGQTSPLVKTAAINGRSAYWSAQTLWWEYGPGGWASINQNRGHPQYSSHAFTVAQLREIAAGVRYGLSYPIRDPFQYDGVLPSGWTGTPLSYQFFEVKGRPVSAEGLFLHGGTGDAFVLVLPAGTGPSSHCHSTLVNGVLTENPTKTPQHATVDGAQALIWTVNGSWAWHQVLCAQNIDGLYVDISLDIGHPYHRTQVGNPLGGVLGVMHDTRLLGTNWANWVADPMTASQP